MPAYTERYSTGSISEALSRISQLHIRLTHANEEKVFTPSISFFQNDYGEKTKWTLDTGGDSEGWSVVSKKKESKPKTHRAHSSGGGGPAAASTHRSTRGRVEFMGDGERYLQVRCLEADIIELDITDYTRKSIPPCDIKQVPIDTPEAKVWAYNYYVMKPRGKGLQTDLIRNPRIESADTHDFPSGLAVFEPLDTELGDKSCEELELIFQHKIGTYNPNKPSTSGSDILYFGKKDQRENSFISAANALRDIQDKGFSALHDFIVLHINAILATTGGTPEIIHETALNLIRYKPNHGIFAHIDNISDFGGQFGPIFTVAMGKGPKYLDLLPILTSEDKPSIRLITSQYQTILVQGEARSDYAHAVPCGNEETQYTIALKFPEVKEGTPGHPYYSEMFGLVPTVKLRLHV